MSQTPHIWQAEDFDQWRKVSRWLLQNGVPPSDIVWQSEDHQPSLLKASTVDSIPESEGTNAGTKPSVPRNFIELAERVACHQDEARWSILYTALWRLNHGERHLLELASDDVTRQLMQWNRQVARDCHKMKAFVRFTKVAEQPQETYVAWYKPDHRIVRLVAPFFSRRFKEMVWTILTPHASAHWDGQKLSYGAGVDASHAPNADELVELWRDYYRSTFNPARIKIKAMKREMPVRFWEHLPEASTIDELLRDAPSRVAKMHVHAIQQSQSAKAFIPEDLSLSSLQAALERCEGCDLCRNGTRVVPGIGSTQARLMIIGEQPGDIEEQRGVPFVGPAGELLDRLLRAADIQRETVYVTNVVKHFHHQVQGKRRLHQRPSPRHEVACTPWLEAEVQLLQPKIVLGLGLTAQRALLGRQLKLADVLGQSHRSWACDRTYIAWHPASILRTTASLARQREDELLAVLRSIRSEADF